MSARPAVFLDRDGVIIEESPNPGDPDAVRLIPGAATAIVRLNAAGIPVIVVTNQAGVGRGLYPEAAVHAVHRRLDQLLAAVGAKIDRYYFCPHHPTAGEGVYRRDCQCRKPRPGMLLQAADELGLSLAESVLVGDKLSDIEAGLAAGGRAVMVLTGYGREQSQLPAFAPRRDLVPLATDLAEAIAQHVLTD